jgi:type I restriction enzyme, S subunit
MIFSKYETYKDSHIPGVDLIPNHWEILPLCAVSKMKSITNCRDKELLSVYLDLGVIRFSDVNEKRTNATSDDLSKYQEVSPGDFVLNNQQAWRGSVGVSKYDGIVSPAYIVLELRTGIDASFANYFFRHGAMVSQYLICSRGVGTIQRNLYWPQLKRVQVALPPLAEQQRITSFLDQKTAGIDEAIAKKQRLIELLKEQKDILINDAVTKGLNCDVPKRESGVEWVGIVPSHWDIKRAKYLFREIDDRSQDGAEELLSVSHLTGVTPRSEKNVNMFMAEDYSGSKLCKEGDLVFNIMWAWMGALGVSDRTGIVSPSYGVYRQRLPGIFNAWYLEHLVRSHNYVAEYNRRSTGLNSSRLRLYSHMFFDMEIGFPPRGEQDEIEKQVTASTGRIDKTVLAIDAEIEKLKELREILISQAVTGKIKI